MGIELSAEDRAGMSPDEIEALTGADAESNLRAHGEEAPAAKDEDADEAAIDAAAADATAAAADKAGDDDAAAVVETPKPDDTPPADGAAAVVEPADAPTLEEMADALDIDAPAPTAPRPYTVDARDIKAERKALETKLDEIDDKWTAGELTDAERKVQMRPLREQANNLLAEEAVQTALRTVNEQNAEQSLNQACNAIIAEAKKAGTIDYIADAKAAKQFDGFLSMHVEEHPGKSAGELAALAHKSMMAFRGIAAAPAPAAAAPAVAAPAVAAPAAPAAPAARRAAPTVTLAGIPAASPTGMENDVLDKFANLEGDEAEDYLASLSPLEQARVLRAADAGAMQHKQTSRGARGRAEARE